MKTSRALAALTALVAIGIRSRLAYGLGPDAGGRAASARGTVPG